MINFLSGLYNIFTAYYKLLTEKVSNVFCNTVAMAG